MSSRNIRGSGYSPHPEVGAERRENVTIYNTDGGSMSRRKGSLRVWGWLPWGRTPERVLFLEKGGRKHEIYHPSAVSRGEVKIT